MAANFLFFNFLLISPHGIISMCKIHNIFYLHKYKRIINWSSFFNKVYSFVTKC